jgi:probable rRNA maturation factor
MSDDGPPTRAPLRVRVVDAKGLPLPDAPLARWLSGVAPRRARGQVTVAIVSDARVRALNRQYRGIDRPTDVLSFPSPDQRVPRQTRARRGAPARDRSRTGGSRHIGDIVIARGVARRQAAAAGHDERIEWRVLALHGLLHLLGYDHETDTGAMARLEARLRRAGRLPAGLIEREPAR